ncbi:MAG: PilZ domain-containing protein [gamma proteobacterium symbiont of Phacoides pectinatus]
MSADEANSEANPERRRFFRIDDAVSLTYDLVPPDQLQARLERMQGDQERDFTVMSDIAAVTQEMAGIMHKLELGEPDIAKYLKALDRKINILGRAFLLHSGQISPHQAHAVNLSASGMAFEAADAFAPGDLLELRLVLMGSFTGILILARVVESREITQTTEGDRYALRVDFTHLRDTDRDILISHIIRRQSDQLRRRREALEEAEDQVEASPESPG